jgi:hypothetical protein
MKTKFAAATNAPPIKGCSASYYRAILPVCPTSSVSLPLAIQDGPFVALDVERSQIRRTKCRPSISPLYLDGN